MNRLAGRIGSVAVGAIRDDTSASTNREEITNAPVLTGIDVLQRDGFQWLHKKRVGLVTNHTGLDSKGKRTIDVLYEAEDVNLVALFSPEHGIQGVRDDNKIGDGTDESTGLPIFSLYGERRMPTPDALKMVDVLFFDIQDIGTRFYTYISTMGNCLRAAAEARKPFIVLDRPNPLGGVVVDGPVLDAGLESFVGFHTIPVQHGMTVAELARMFRKELDLDVKLNFVALENWRREMLWDQTQLRWIDPSPNMRSLTEAILYPGIGLLETTNLSVGRGTDRPFEVIGAPWIEERSFAARLNSLDIPGVRFVPRRFTPKSSVYRDEDCGGVDILIVDREAVRSIEVGLRIAVTLRAMYLERWQAEKMQRLLCDKVVLDALLSGADWNQIESLFKSDLIEFGKRRASYLIY